eukprot:COSAG02_NODE_1178_length_14042_cov_11.526674_8_plen_68_part_00
METRLWIIMQRRTRAPPSSGPGIEDVHLHVGRRRAVACVGAVSARPGQRATTLCPGRTVVAVLWALA